MLPQIFNRTVTVSRGMACILTLDINLYHGKRPFDFAQYSAIIRSDEATQPQGNFVLTTVLLRIANSIQHNTIQYNTIQGLRKT